MHTTKDANPARPEQIRQRLRSELDTTRQEFHQLLNEIAEEDLDQPSLNPTWTIREVLYHMSLAPRNLPSDVRLIRHLKWVPRIPAGPFNRLNAYLTQRGARKTTKNSLAEKYDQAHARTLGALETIADEEWAFGVNYPDWDPMLSEPVTLERLFQYISLHFNAHAQEIKAVLGASEFRT